MGFPKVLVILCALALLSTAASAASCTLSYGAQEIEVTIQVNRDMAYIIPMKVGDKLIVELEVAEGGPVDFFFTNSTAYDVYLASISGNMNFDSLFVIEDYSRRETGSISYEYDALVENELVVLIDNTGYTVGGADPIGPVTVVGKITVQRNVWTPVNIIITAIVIIIIIAVMVGIKWPRAPSPKP